MNYWKALGHFAKQILSHETCCVIANDLNQLLESPRPCASYRDIHVVFQFIVN